MKRMEERYKHYVEKARTVRTFWQDWDSQAIMTRMSRQCARDSTNLLFFPSSFNHHTDISHSLKSVLCDTLCTFRVFSMKPTLCLCLQYSVEVRVFRRQVIKTLDPNQPANSSPDIQALKNQLSEKERKIHHLEVNLFVSPAMMLCVRVAAAGGGSYVKRCLWPTCGLQHDYEKSRARLDKEEKLIISAWYNMVSNVGSWLILFLFFFNGFWQRVNYLSVLMAWLVRRGRWISPSSQDSDTCCSLMKALAIYIHNTYTQLCQKRVLNI